jgi:hypothetical protein
LVRRASLRAFLKGISTRNTRRATPALVVVLAAGLTACGSSGGHFANNPRPPSPVNLTVYINDHRVSISPASLGAGPVVFIVTNQASRAESLTIVPAGDASAQPATNTPGCPSTSPALACTGPISPMATAQVKVNLVTGAYTVATTGSGGTAAAAATSPGIQPALLRIGGQRPNSSGQLLVP